MKVLPVEMGRFSWFLFFMEKVKRILNLTDLFNQNCLWRCLDCISPTDF